MESCGRLVKAFPLALVWRVYALEAFSALGALGAFGAFLGVVLLDDSVDVLLLEGVELVVLREGYLLRMLWLGSVSYRAYLA